MGYERYMAYCIVVYVCILYAHTAHWSLHSLHTRSTLQALLRCEGGVSLRIIYACVTKKNAYILYTRNAYWVLLLVQLY